MYNLYQDVHQSQRYKKFREGDLLLAEYTCEPGDLRDHLWSQNHYFTFVTKGKLELSTLNGQYLLEAGKAFFVRKGSCSFQLFKEEMYCELILFVTDEMIRSVLNRHNIQLKVRNHSQQVDLVIPLEQSEVLDTYRQSLLVHFQKAQAPSPALLQVKFEELLLNLLGQEDAVAFHQCLWEISDTGKLSITHIMEQNFCSDLSLSEFAQLCARSLSSFRRDFIQVYGMPPGKWLKEKRLERSKLLLANTNKKMEDICFECGFKNRSHYSRLFKAHAGLSPQAYRRQASSTSRV